jgi:hypothetical protein
MKKSLIGLLVIAMAFCAVQSAQAVTAVWLNPSSQSVANSTVVTVELLVSGAVAPGVDTWNYVLQFDTTLLNVTGAHIGGDFLPYFDQFMDVGEGYTTFGPGLDNTNGELSFTLWNSGTLGATGAGTVAIITFVTDASNDGTADLDYTAWLVEPGTGNYIAHTESTGDNIIINGGEGPVIPEPATMMLVAAGLAALGGYARKKRS